jgi:hypothetical protein
LIDKITVKPGVSKPYWRQWRFDPELIDVAWKH